jgi:beta-N-acetylhexosaminidase
MADVSATNATNAMRGLCGQLVIGGFEGTALPRSFARALAAGERGGAILFARNLTQDPMQCAELSRAIAEAAGACPPLISIDQEGGRVARLKAPVLELPPMRWFGDLGGPARALATQAATALARQLAALGITMSFAPVLDVNTCAENPVIGDRAFGEDPEIVSELGVAWMRGLHAGGVLACGKHFPGHGGASKDSHLDLPVIALDERTLATVHELPFLRAAGAAQVAPAFMTAHAVYPALDPEWPATLSREVLARLRRAFDGCIVSDDLEMKAIADRWSIEDSAVLAIEAGCDALLVCKSEELQDRAIDALANRAAAIPMFAARVREAHARCIAMRQRMPPKPVRTRAEFDAASDMAREVAATLARQLGRAS